LKEWKQQRINFRIYGKVILAQRDENMTVISRELIVSFKQHLQWRV